MLRITRVLQLAIAASLLLSTLLFILWSRHWPLVGDAALIHYIAFLTSRGMAPYRVLGDMNMPGSFLIEMAAMRVFGPGDLAWRIFDLTLLATAAAAIFVITRRSGWFPGVFAATLFALVHGRDGLAEGGQRDLTMAALLLLATAFLFIALRRRNTWPLLAFGLLSGLALTIKPTALPLSLAQLGVSLWTLRRQHPTASLRRPALSALAAMLPGPALALAFLLHQHALGAFLHGLRTIVPYYASLGHKPLGFLLLHSVSPLLPLVILWLAVLLAAWPPRDPERALLYCGVLFGLISYVVQARGLPYYRYPLLAFLLPLVAIDLTRALTPHTWHTRRARLAGAFSIAALCFGGFFLGPQSALLAHRYRWWETDFISTLETSLQRLGGPQLAGRIQCIDSISGCGTTLYRMRLVPATGILSDFLLFGPASVPAIQEARAQLQSSIETRPPRVMVVSSWLHMDGPDNFEKLQRWPWLQQLLAQDYRLDTQWSPTRRTRWWSREETPASYRIYVHR